MPWHPSSPERNTDPEPLIEEIAQLRGTLEIAQDEIASKLQEVIARYENCSFGSLEANKRVATNIELLIRDLRHKALGPTTQVPCHFEAIKAGRAVQGTFRWSYYDVAGKKTNDISSVVIKPFAIARPVPYENNQTKDAA